MISKKTVLILAISYFLLTFILYNVLGTAIGGLLRQISFLALAVGVIYFILRFIKLAI